MYNGQQAHKYRFFCLPYLYTYDGEMCLSLLHGSASIIPLILITFIHSLLVDDSFIVIKKIMCMSFNILILLYITFVKLTYQL